MATIKTKDLFVVAAEHLSVDISNVFTTTDAAETWRTDNKNIDPKFQQFYKVIPFDEWLSLVKSESYDYGRNDGANESFISKVLGRKTIYC